MNSNTQAIDDSKSPKKKLQPLEKKLRQTKHQNEKKNDDNNK